MAALSHLEKMILFAADENGRLAIPKCDKEGVKVIRTALARMKRRGFVYRQKTFALNCLPYALTAMAQDLKNEIVCRDCPLDEAETAILCSANEQGQIDIPCGSAMEIDRFLATLVGLEKIGFVARIPDGRFYCPFKLTEKGVAFKTTVGKASPQNVGMEIFASVPIAT